MISKEIVKTYLHFYNAYRINKSRQPSVVEQEAINQLVEKTKTDRALSQFLIELQKENRLQEQNRKIEEYFRQERTNKREEEAIAKTFGIDISKIKHQFLQNGKELFIFYSDYLGQNVVLENKKEGESLVHQLKEMQLESERYQTDNHSRNTEEMLNRKRMKENRQLVFLPIKQIENNKDILEQLDEKQLVQLSVLLQNAVSLHFNSINLENMLAMDEFQNIYETYYNVEKKGYTIQKPDEASYHEENIQYSNEMKSTTTNDLEKYENSYEDIPSLLMHDVELTISVEEAMQRIKMYFAYPEMLQTLPEGEKQFYIKYTEMYKKYIERGEKEKEKPKRLFKTRRNLKKAGYIDAFVLALITGFGAGILFTLTSFLFR